MLPRKKLLAGISFFSIRSQFSTKNDNSKLHRYFYTIIMNLLSHMQKFNRVAKLKHKYTELANKNKIFSAVSGNADKNYSDKKLWHVRR